MIQLAFIEHLLCTTHGERSSGCTHDYHGKATTRVNGREKSKLRNGGEELSTQLPQYTKIIP